MSCVDVMYQTYSTYFPYQRSSVPPTSMASSGVVLPGTSGIGLDKRYKMLEATPGAAQSSSVSDTYATLIPPSSHLPTSSTSSSETIAQPDDGNEDEKNETRAHYLSANCVVFTYYTGDIGAMVDEHFSRALNSNGTSFNGQTTNSKDSSSKAACTNSLSRVAPTVYYKRQMLNTETSSPMAHRNFPPSFWDSNYHQHHPHHVFSGGHAHPDFYSSPTTDTHPYAAIHQSEAWHYPAYSHHRSMHDLAYSSRFSPQPYSSFLMRPGARLSGAQCKADAWSTARYHDSIHAGDITHNLEASYGPAAHPYAVSSDFNPGVPARPTYYQS